MTFSFDVSAIFAVHYALLTLILTVFTEIQLINLK